MSGTLGASKTNIRRLMRDFPIGSQAPGVPDEVLDALINSWLVRLNAELDFATTWSSNAIALVAGTRLYQLASTDYQQLSMLRRHTDGRILQPASESEIQSRYQSITAAAGSPLAFALWEGTDGKLNVDLWPTPDAAAVVANAALDAFIETSATPLTVSADSILLSVTAVAALEALVAGDGVAGMDQGLLESKKIPATLAQTLSAQGHALLTSEKVRRERFHRQDSVLRVRF